MSFVTVAALDELKDDVPLACTVNDDLTVALVRSNGELFAIEDRCSHAEVPLSEGDVFGCSIECYLHGAAFDLRTGEALNLPATESVRVFPVRIDGSDIQVDPANPLNA